MQVGRAKTLQADPSGRTQGDGNIGQQPGGRAEAAVARTSASTPSPAGTSSIGSNRARKSSCNEKTVMKHKQSRAKAYGRTASQDRRARPAVTLRWWRRQAALTHGCMPVCAWEHQAGVGPAAVAGNCGPLDFSRRRERWTAQHTRSCATSAPAHQNARSPQTEVTFTIQQPRMTSLAHLQLPHQRLGPSECKSIAG